MVKTKCYEHIVYEKAKRKRRKETERQQKNEQGVLPPLLSEETSVNEIDSFPTRRHNQPPPSVFDKHTLTHA